MATVSLTENQLNQVNSFIENLGSGKNKNNYRLGVCGEIAFHNYGLNEKIFNNFYGDDLFNSILMDKKEADAGHDFIAQSINNKFVKLFVQIKTTSLMNGHNIPLSKSLYNAKLEYYNGIPQDIYVFVRKLSESTYDILGFITHENAVNCYVADRPILGCYCIHEKYLRPIEELSKFL